MTSRRTSTAEDKDQHSSKTTLNELPLELLDFVLENSFLHWIVSSSSPNRTDKDVIKALASVDFCWFQRVARRRFKNRIWQRLRGLYEKTKKISAIIRNNTNYLLENIQPKDELIHLLLSYNCITEEQSQCIKRPSSKRDKNDELLHLVRSFDETKSSNFVKCLRQTNQKTVARIIDSGGGVITVEVKNRDTTCATSMNTQLLHQTIEDLLNKTKPRSHQTDKLLSQLKSEGIEILRSQLDRQTLVVWIWCRTQAAIVALQKRYELNQLRDVFFACANFGPSASEFIQPKVINIDSNQFKKTVVVCQNSLDFTQRLNVEDEYAFGVTKLRNEVYILGRSKFPSFFPNVIRVFEDQTPFRLQKKIEIKGIEFPWDIGSSEKENCLYVSDPRTNCVWKITKEKDNQHNVIEWLTTDYAPRSLSVSSDGQLLLLTYYSLILRIYGSDAKLIRSIRLATDIKNPIHAVKTSIGNFVVLHQWTKKEEEETERWWIISELTRDGQMVINRFIPSDETQQLNNPCYVSFDSDDQVFVADSRNDRVVLLDSDLKWNRIICPANEEEDGEEKRIKCPERLCYDEAKKQLIVGGINVYVLYGK